LFETVEAFCEHETLSCLICQIIVSVAPQCCNECSRKDGFMSISGIDTCGDAVSFEYEPETILLTIKANKRVVERHKQVIKELLHYPELVRLEGCEAM